MWHALAALFGHHEEPADFTIVVVDHLGIPVQIARIVTPCGCSSYVDPRTGTWTGTALPGPNGQVALVPGAFIQLSVTSAFHDDAEASFVVKPRQHRYVVGMMRTPIVVDDFEEPEEQVVRFNCRPRYSPPDEAISVFKPTAPPASPAPETPTPAATWTCDGPSSP